MGAIVARQDNFHKTSLMRRLHQFDRLLKKISVEAALNAEMTHHLGHGKHQPKSGTNTRNGYL
jgi:transposase-like protein